jgi:hypothetical protein
MAETKRHDAEPTKSGPFSLAASAESLDMAANAEFS